MDIKNKVPIALIMTVAILVGGGAVYLKIKPGPGKRVKVTQPRSAKKEALTPAEQAVKKVIESRLLSKEQIYRNATFKEIKNDGYEAVVLADAELRIGDRWFEKRAVGTARKIGDTWKGEIELFFENKRVLRAWRDVDILAVKDIIALPPETLVDEKECGGKKITTKYKASIDAENKGDIPHTIKFTMYANAKSPIEGKCYENESIFFKPAEIDLPPKKAGTYQIGLEIDRSQFPNCCVFKGAELDTSLLSHRDRGELVKFLEVDGIAEKRSDYWLFRSWWLENPQYVP